MSAWMQRVVYALVARLLFLYALPRRYQRWLMRLLSRWLIPRVLRTAFRSLLPKPDPFPSPPPVSPPDPSPPTPRLARHSRVEMTQVLLQKHADPRGVAYSGTIMAWIDICAGMAAKTHSQRPCVTASVDAVHFLQPIHLGEVVVLRGAVNRSWRTSMEVGVRVEAESLLTGVRRYCCHAYLTFVGLDGGRPALVPALVPETELERQWFQDAEARRAERIAVKVQQRDSPVSRERRGTEDEEMLREQPYLDHAAFQYPLPGVLSEWTPEHTFGSQARPSRHSYTQNMNIVMPQHANSLGVTFGGHIIELMEQCAMVAALRQFQDAKHKDSTVLFRTASIDSLNFLHPTHVGDVITVRAYVSRVWHSSMEIYITVHAHSVGYTASQNEDGAKQKSRLKSAEKSEDGTAVVPPWMFTNDGYLTVVAVTEATANDYVKPMQSPQLTEEAPALVTGRRRAGSVRSTNPHERVLADPDLPEVIPSSEEEQWRYRGATARRERRLKERSDLIAHAAKLMMD